MSNQTVRQRISEKVNPNNNSDTPFLEIQNKTRSSHSDGQSSPGYLSQYGLREAAFSSKIDDRFFFLDANHAQRLNQIHNLIQDHHLFLHIMGVSGIGKSSFINRFINIGEEDWRFSYFSANTMMNSEQLYFNISAGFGLSGIPDKNIDIRDNCINNIAMLEKSGVIPILIIDDVQELAIETLQSVFELVNRWDKNHPNLRIIIISNPQFNVTLGSSQLSDIRHSISHVMEIEALSEEQIEQYIYYRLSVAGLDGGNPITPKACKTILNKSKGIPRVINRLCHLALRDGMDEMTMKDFFDEHNFSFPIRKYLISGAIIAIFLGIFINIFDSNQTQQHISNNELFSIKNNNTNTAISDSSLFSYFSNNKHALLDDNYFIPDSKIYNIKSENTLSSMAVPLTDTVKEYKFFNLQLNFNNRVLSKNTNIIANITKLQYIKNNLIKKERGKFEPSTVVVKTKAISNDLMSKKSTVIANKKYPLISSINPTKITAGQLNQKIHIIGEEFSANSSVMLYQTDGFDVIAKNRIKFYSKKHLEISIDIGNITGKRWLVVTDPIKGKSNGFLFKVVKPINSVAKKNDNLKDEKWILNLNSDFYILYLRSSKNKQEIVKFARNGLLTGQYALFKTNRRGTIWYHLIIGTYNTKDLAKLATKSYPNELTKPWIRSVGDIQRAIKKI